MARIPFLARNRIGMARPGGTVPVPVLLQLMGTA
jgi:hypothetical protein